MRKIIENNELGIPYTNRFNRLMVDFASKNLGLDRLNELYDSVYGDDGLEFAAAILKKMNIESVVQNSDLSHIPQTGAYIAIVNHPHGALDGLLLANLIVRKRPDTKFMGNYLLEKIKPMSTMFLPVNPFDGKASRNVPAMRAAIAHVEQGGGLIIFPAGEVSTYYNGFSICEDKEWPIAIMKFIKRMRVPVVPVYISGKNSLKFHLVGKIHPILRTVRLPLELLNKVNEKVMITIGSPITVRRQDELVDIEHFSGYLRANVYYLMQYKEGKKKSKPTPVPEVLVNRVDVMHIEAELETLDDSCLLLTVGDYRVYECCASEITHTLKEICRLREIVFRQIGEGTNRAEDRDDYDHLYNHLFIWHAEKRCIVGAYRVGYGAKIIKEHGIDGFYSNSLFEYTAHFSEVLEKSIELGRSFIVPDFQKRTKPLMLLWQGILKILLKHSDYQYLLGPVSMSSSYSLKAKIIAVNYIKEHHWGAQYAKMVVPRNGIKQLKQLKINTSLLKNISEINLIDKLIIDLDYDKTPLPVLLRKYLQLGGVVLAFNIDPTFNDSLDALMLLDIKKVPTATLDMLNRELNDVNIKKRFSK